MPLWAVGTFLSAYNYAWAGDLKPLDSSLSARQRADLLPSIRQQGTYGGHMWGVGTFDSGLGLYVRPSILRRAGISIPTDPSQAWTAAQFTRILARLRAMGYRQPLDLQISYASKARANGAVPGTYSAIRESPRFAAGGPEHLYVEQLETGVARPRPQTPAYPGLTAAFAGALQSIVVGLRPVKPTLAAAARAVTKDLIAHDYYANTER